MREILDEVRSMLGNESYPFAEARMVPSAVGIRRTGIFVKPAYKRALKRGFVDLGLFSAKMAKDLRRRRMGYRVRALFLDDLWTLLQTKKVAFVKDPHGIIDPKGLKDWMARAAVSYEAEEYPYAVERDDMMQAETLSNRIKYIESKFKVRVQPVKGRTGKGWRVTWNTDPDRLSDEAERKFPGRQ